MCLATNACFNLQRIFWCNGIFWLTFVLNTLQLFTISIMSNLVLYSKIDLLPDHLKQQVMDYIEFLLSREQKDRPEKTEKKKPKFNPGYGGAKGMIKLSPDWDESIEDFKDYM
jgi:Protein of unknown function (DUF2281)